MVIGRFREGASLLFRAQLSIDGFSSPPGRGVLLLATGSNSSRMTGSSFSLLEGGGEGGEGVADVPRDVSSFSRFPFIVLRVVILRGWYFDAED